MSGEALGARRIVGEFHGGAEDGQRVAGLEFDGAPHALLLVDSKGIPWATSPSGAIHDPAVLLDLLGKALFALRTKQAGL